LSIEHFRIAMHFSANQSHQCFQCAILFSALHEILVKRRNAEYAEQIIFTLVR